MSTAISAPPPAAKEMIPTDIFDEIYGVLGISERRPANNNGQVMTSLCHQLQANHAEQKVMLASNPDASYMQYSTSLLMQLLVYCVCLPSLSSGVGMVKVTLLEYFFLPIMLTTTLTWYLVPGTMFSKTTGSSMDRL